MYRCIPILCSLTSCLKKILRDLLNGEYRGVLYRKVARTLMRISPPLISPIAYSERSLKNNTLYDSSNEVYTIVESTLQEGFAQGVFTAFCPCYSRECQPGQGGCYSPCCPNRTSRRGVEKQVTLTQCGLYHALLCL